MTETRRECEDEPIQATFDKLVDECLSTAEKLGVSIKHQNALSIWLCKGLDSGWSNVKQIFAEVWRKTEKDSVIREQLKAAVRSIASQFCDINAYYIAKVLCETTEQDHGTMILEHARAHGAIDPISKDVNLDLAMTVEERGTAQEIDKVLALKLPMSGGFDDIHGQVKDVLENIWRLLKTYTRHLQLPSRHGNVYQLLFPTAALQLHEQNYDIAIGVLHGGANIVNYMHPLGQNSGYLEWHRHWQRNPTWITKNRTEIRKGMRVLLCENDACSGDTLINVMRKLDSISPSSVDVCFTGIRHKASKDVAGKMNAFGRIMHLTDLSSERIFSDMLKYKQLLTDVMAGTE
ncbi:hypothetical protein HYW84_00440 [Candidatus Peregrinibacteria bacterium]|nr:hypothetical protein [Candidatus Peregrinibacteria bacterium]